jgi:hypothetical protein
MARFQGLAAMERIDDYTRRAFGDAQQKMTRKSEPGNVIACGARGMDIKNADTDGKTGAPICSMS